MCYFFFFKRNTAYELLISDWSSDVCSSDLHDILQRHDERPIRRHLFVPPTIFGGKHGADEHLVDWRVKLHPGITVGEIGGVTREQTAKILILEIADPVRQDRKSTRLNSSH